MGETPMLHTGKMPVLREEEHVESMFLKVLRAKIHRATVTEANPDYVGSITIDQDLSDAAGILPNESVLVADVTNGERFETYVVSGERGSGTVCVNGAAARLARAGDLVIVMAHAYVTPEEAREMQPVIVLVDEKNRPAGPTRKAQ
jgi:aspartate 1-decarboxylase